MQYEQSELAKENELFQMNIGIMVSWVGFYCPFFSVSDIVLATKQQTRHKYIYQSRLHLVVMKLC